MILAVRSAESVTPAEQMPFSRKLHERHSLRAGCLSEVGSAHARVAWLNNFSGWAWMQFSGQGSIYIVTGNNIGATPTMETGLSCAVHITMNIMHLVSIPRHGPQQVTNLHPQAIFEHSSCLRRLSMRALVGVWRRWANASNDPSSDVLWDRP